MTTEQAADWLEFELLCLVKDEFSLDARIKRARRGHRPCRHLTHFRKLVNLAALRAA